MSATAFSDRPPNESPEADSPPSRPSSPSEGAGRERTESAPPSAPTAVPERTSSIAVRSEEPLERAIALSFSRVVLPIPRRGVLTMRRRLTSSSGLRDHP